MSRNYSEALREQILNEYRNGRTVRSLAADYEPHEMTIRSWIHQQGVVPNDGVESDAEHYRRVMRENRRLQEENVILTKAAAWFASQSDGRAMR